MRITLSQAIEGFTLAKQAEHLSHHTLLDYQNSFRKLQAHLPGDPYLDAITKNQVQQLLADLGERPQPRPGIAYREAKPLSKKMILNIHTGLSSLWTWALREGYANRHIIREIPRARPEVRAINPFTEDDAHALLAVCARTKSYTRPGKRKCANARPTGHRDEAILLLLFDTGMRATELATLTIGQTDLKNQRVRVFGKGARERMLPISSRTSKALWKYITAGRQTADLSDPLFVTRSGQPYTSQALLLLTRSLGQRAGVPNCHPHRFRHTFAITYLRNGGDPYTLQALLGHSTMDMVRRYLNLAQADIERVHRRASPVSNWDL